MAYGDETYCKLQQQMQSATDHYCAAVRFRQAIAEHLSPAGDKAAKEEIARLDTLSGQARAAFTAYTAPLYAVVAEVFQVPPEAQAA